MEDAGGLAYGDPLMVLGCCLRCIGSVQVIALIEIDVEGLDLGLCLCVSPPRTPEGATIVGEED